jgi:SAM-dependent methyltransferase
MRELPCPSILAGCCAWLLRGWDSLRRPREHPRLEDGSIDILVTSDVFEHVIDTEAAMSEVARVLAPGGVHIWTTPQYQNLERSRPRVRRGPDGLEYLLPAEFHGDSVNEQGVIVSYDGGRDLPEIVKAASGMSTAAYRIESAEHGLLGEFLKVFVSRRPSAANGNGDYRSAAAETSRLEAAIDDLAECRRALASIETPRSWRLTKPLRAIAAVARGRRRSR